MSEDELLRELGKLVRREGVEEEEPRPTGTAFDERWDRLAAGTLDAREEAELRALAESSAEMREAHEAFRPLGPDFQAEVVRAIRAQARRPGATRLDFPRRHLRVAGLGVAAAAAVAAAVVGYLRPPPLPGYVLGGIAGGSRSTRDDAGGERSFAPGDRFVLTLRPQTEVPGGGSLEARAYLMHRRELWPVEVRAELDSRGAVKVTGVVPPRLESNEVPLSIVVGRRGSMPELDELDVSGGRAPLRRRNWVAVPVTLPARPRAP
jgi:hypothetical protein